MIPVTREIYVLLLREKLLENEALRKERENGDRAEESWFWAWNEWKVSLRLCRLRTVPLLAVLTKFEQY